MTVHQLHQPLHRAPAESVQGSLALDLGGAQRPPAQAGTTPQHGLADVISIDPGVRGHLDAWVPRFGQAVVEVVGGDRPVSQLLRWSSPEVYADLHRRAVLVARAGDHEPGQRRVQPVRPHVASARTSFVTTRAAEASVRLRYGTRSRALALRFERRRARVDDKPRWVCVAIEFA